MKRFAPALLLLLLATGCDADRLTQFGDFATAGTAYVTTFHTFSQQAGTAFIATDSAVLLTGRDVAGPAVISANTALFARNVTDSDAQMQQYPVNLARRRIRPRRGAGRPCRAQDGNHSMDM